VKAAFSWSPSEHEDGLALFVDPSHRRRFRAVLSMNERRRHEALFYLRHFSHRLDPRFAYRLPLADHSAARVLDILTANRAPSTCYIVSNDDRLDGQAMPLANALKIVVDDDTPRGWMHSFGEGALISCIPGRLGFYHDHEVADSQFVLARPATGGKH
jgi:hypothetical protein